ncbi:D-serine dehydratase [compost metagenome]
MHACEGHELEPSALAGVPGMVRVLQEQQGYRHRLGLDEARMSRATHLVWGTGGSMVPRAEMDAYLAKGRVVLAGQ